jgi:HlyD family secretion protein
VVSELKVAQGERVKKAQILALLGTYQTLAANLKQAEAEVSSRKARLQQIQAGASKASINAQQAKVDRLKVELNSAESKCSRASVLQEKQAISRNEQEEECVKKSSLQSQLREAQANLVATAEVRSVDVAVAKAELGKADAALLKAKLELENAMIRAPVDGQVLNIHAKAGEIIDKQGLFDFGQTASMWIRAEIYETDIGKIHIGQKATISSDGLSGKLQGTVQEVGLVVGKNHIVDVKPSNQSDARVVEVKIKLNDKDSAQVAQLTHLQVSVVIEISKN